MSSTLVIVALVTVVLNGVDGERGREADQTDARIEALVEGALLVPVRQTGDPVLVAAAIETL